MPSISITVKNKGFANFKSRNKNQAVKMQTFALDPLKSQRNRNDYLSRNMKNHTVAALNHNNNAASHAYFDKTSNSHRSSEADLSQGEHIHLK